MIDIYLTAFAEGVQLLFERAYYFNTIQKVDSFTIFIVKVYFVINLYDGVMYSGE